MLFDSPVYFVFLIVVVLLYWTLSWRGQNLMLLAASYFFYGWWDWRFLGLILTSTVVDFFCARFIAASSNPPVRKLLLTISVVVNLTFLGFFKYFNFFADSLVPILAAAGIPIAPLALRILLPVGISFYTFQAVAYIVDVYLERLRPAGSLVDYALFISLFPHLIAGPIQRPSHLLPQVAYPRRFESGSFFDGMVLILTGLFRKCVVADNAALLANAAFAGQFGAPSTMSVLIGTYAFAWQIYGDFSGYSDIARGSAQLLGFHFMVNFRQPYLAQSLQDFWRRWHISLSSWLRDYLYIPLGGNRGTDLETQRNLLTTMLLGGLWHGANWTFVVWGGIHGAGLAIERYARRLLDRPDRGPATCRSLASAAVLDWAQRIVMFHLVCAAWIFFRAQSIGDAIAMLAGLGQWNWRPEYLTMLVFLVAVTLPLFGVDLLLEYRGEEYPFATARFSSRLAGATAVLVLVLLFSANQPSAFIYFQF